MLRICFRFRRASAALSVVPNGGDLAGGGYQDIFFSGSVPAGVNSNWVKTEERSYFEGVTSASSDKPEVVQTQRKTVQSGLQLQALAARLPGGMFRIDGTLTISSFVGTGLNRAVADLPLQVDGPRGQWVRCLLIRGGDLAAELAIERVSLNATAGGDALEVSVLVE
jgi:hypothetical protein